jgi:hypothetical protein
MMNSAPNDTVVCLSPVSQLGLLIDKSIDIDCSGARAVVRDNTAQGAAISINIPVSSNDPFRTVRLRGLSIGGALSNEKFIPRGIDIVEAAVVYLEGVVISDATEYGVLDRRFRGTARLYVSDTIIRNNDGPGIGAGSAKGFFVLDNVRLENNTYGLAAAKGNSVVINRSVLSGNSVAGVEGDPGAQIVVNNSTISHNGKGVESNSSVRLSNNDIAFNITAIAGVSGTFGNNRFSGNDSLGTAPTPLGSASSDVGQQ